MTSKNILLLGSTSFTASHILHNLSKQYSFRRVGRQSDKVDVDFNVYLDDIEKLAADLEWADVVINCFSNGDVDSCEENPELSAKLNLEFPIALSNTLKSHSAHLIHFSSNAVYDGDNPLYSEDSEQHSVNIYGNLKSEADAHLKTNCQRCTILRPITMYGQLLGDQRHNPFSFFLDKFLNNQDVIAVNDVYVNMLHVDVLIECINNVIHDEIYGEFNVSGDDVVNRFEFVCEIMKHLPQSTSKITQTDSSNFKTAARRPLDTSFDNSKMKSELNVYPKPLATTLQLLVSDALSKSKHIENTKRAA